MKNKDFNIDTQKLKRKIGLSAIYFKLNDQHHRTFFGEDDDGFKEGLREHLENSWEVPAQSGAKRLLTLKNYKLMVEKLDWSKYSGVRSSEVGNTKRFYKPALAWDITGYTDNVRHAYYIDYINKKTALEHLDCAYELSKNHFESWEDYGRSFLLFKSLWDNDNLTDAIENAYPEPKNNYNARDIKEIQEKIYRTPGLTINPEVVETFNYLMYDRESIWNQVTWNI